MWEANVGYSVFEINDEISRELFCRRHGVDGDVYNKHSLLCYINEFSIFGAIWVDDSCRY
jgi:hypothetical protein